MNYIDEIFQNIKYLYIDSNLYITIMWVMLEQNKCIKLIDTCYCIVTRDSSNSMSLEEEGSCKNATSIA